MIPIQSKYCEDILAICVRRRAPFTGQVLGSRAFTEALLLVQPCQSSVPGMSSMLTNTTSSPASARSLLFPHRLSRSSRWECGRVIQLFKDRNESRYDLRLKMEAKL